MTDNQGESASRVWVRLGPGRTGGLRRQSRSGRDTQPRGCSNLSRSGQLMRASVLHGPGRIAVESAAVRALAQTRS